MDCNDVFLRNFEISLIWNFFLSYSLIMDLSITAFFFDCKIKTFITRQG